MKKNYLTKFSYSVNTKLLSSFALLFASLATFAQAKQEAITNALRSNFPSEYVITAQNTSKNSQATHIYLRQSIHGIEVVGTESSLHLDKNGDVLIVHDGFVAGINATIVSNAQNINARQAIEKVAQQMGYPLSGLEQLESDRSLAPPTFLFNEAGISATQIPVKLQYYYRKGIGTQLVWELSVQERTSSDWWNFRVDAANGQIIDKDNWTVYCELPMDKAGSERASVNEEEHFSLFKDQGTSMMMVGSYNVFPLPVESPSHGSRAIVSNPEDLNASPYGWHDTNGSPGSEFTTTRGNNVLAQEDVNGNNGNGTLANGGAGLNFNFPLNLSQQPINYQNAALTNLFFGIT
ncbi:MAG: M36 family metallopeptidase [Flavobacteriaceae bacterium]